MNFVQGRKRRKDGRKQKEEELTKSQVDPTESRSIYKRITRRL